MKHPLQEMMDKRRQGIRCGIPSYCSANELVIEIALRRAKERSIPVLIEATANQVNQFGGYTGMKPADFYQMVLKMAKDIDLPENMMILAGDHLGPLTWQKLPEAEAMKNSVELVYQYARAGFTKIHLDTSMKVADDAPGLLKTEVIARRGAQLYKAAMKGYEELKAEKPDAMRPVFVIGSEVPIPGGATEAEDTLAVTSPDAFRDTVSTYQRVWTEEGRSLLRGIALMGGAAVGGNRTPCSEFNIHADPDAAEIVFSSGVPIVMCGLDVTEQAWFSPEEFAALPDTPVGRFARAATAGPMQKNMARGAGGLCLHDVCPVLYLTHPELFTGRQAGVHVETRGSVTYAKTVTDLDSDAKFPERNVSVVLGVDRAGFAAHITEALRGYAG